MSILAANLKHFYQRRSVWFWHIILFSLLMSMFSLAISSRTESRYLVYLVVSWLIGMVAGDLQKDVLSKPFSFCLPGHRRIVRTFVFWVGGVINLILGCVFFRFPGLDFPYVMLVVLASGFVGMIVYFYGVYVGFIKTPAPAEGIMPLLIGGSIFFKWDMALQNIIIHQPIVIILASAVGCLWAWRLLGRDVLARKYCGKLFFGMLDSWNIEKAQRYQQIQTGKNLTAGKGKFFEKVHRFFLGKMNQYDFLSRGRYIWGTIYLTFGRAISQKRLYWLLALIAMLLLLCFFCYVGSDVYFGGYMVFIVPCLVFSPMKLNVHSSLLVFGGRRERFWSALTLAATTSILTTSIMTFFAALTIPLELMLPELTIKGNIYVFHALNMKLFFVPLLLIPSILTLGLVFYKRPKLAWQFLMLLVLPIFAAIFVAPMYVTTDADLMFNTTAIEPMATIVSMMEPDNLAMHKGLVSVIVIMLLGCSWAVFVGVLRYVCMRCNLVSQSR